MYSIFHFLHAAVNSSHNAFQPFIIDDRYATGNYRSSCECQPCRAHTFDPGMRSGYIFLRTIVMALTAYSSTALFPHYPNHQKPSLILLQLARMLLSKLHSRAASKDYATPLSKPVWKSSLTLDCRADIKIKQRLARSMGSCAKACQSMRVGFGLS